MSGLLGWEDDWLLSTDITNGQLLSSCSLYHPLTWLAVSFGKPEQNALEQLFEESGPEGWRWASKPLGLLLARSSDHVRLANHLWHLLRPTILSLFWVTAAAATVAGSEVVQADMSEHVEFFWRLSSWRAGGCMDLQTLSKAGSAGVLLWFIFKNLVTVSLQMKPWAPKPCKSTPPCTRRQNDLIFVWCVYRNSVAMKF